MVDDVGPVQSARVPTSISRLLRIARARAGALLAALALALGACGAGSASVAPSPAARTDDPDRAEGVGTFVSVPRGFETRSYWIEGPDGLVVVDTQFMPSEAERLIATAERETGKRVAMAIVLHPNPDKFNGADVFRAHGARVVTSQQVLDRIPAVDAIRRRWFYDRYAPDYPEVTPTLEAFGDRSMELDAAGLTLRAHVLGAGCSEAHVVIEWSGHVFVGDLVASGVHSWLELGHLDEWLARLDEIAATGPRRVHPGRGPSGGLELLDAQRAYLERVRTLTREASPVMPPPEGAIDALRARVVEAYPDHGYEVFLRVGLPAVWRAEAEALAR